MDFSNPYFNISSSIITKEDKPFINSLDNIGIKRVGIHKNSTLKDYFRNKYKDIVFFEYENPIQAFKDVENGHLFGYIDLIPNVFKDIQDNYYDSLKINTKLDKTLNLRAAVSIDNINLQVIMAKVINSITEKDITDIKNKYYKLSVSSGKNHTQEYIFWFVGLSFILILFITYRYYIIYGVNKKLEKRISSEIESSNEKNRLIYQQNKLIAMGEMIENIAHQWRQPLSEINARIMQIDDIYTNQIFMMKN